MSINWSSAIVRYKIESSASGTMNILYSPLEGSWLMEGFGCSQHQCQGGTANLFREEKVVRDG